MCRIISPLQLLLLGLGLSAAVREGDVRLVGGTVSSEGRVEVYHLGRWGTVCDDSWDMAEAQVVCRQLRYPGARSAVAGGTYEQGTGKIWLDDLNCKGSEKLLSSCSFKGWGITDCSHSEDAGVVCEKNSVSENKQIYTLDHSLSLVTDLEELFDSGRDCDLNITFWSPDMEEAGNEEVVCLHSVILSLHSEHFTFNSFQNNFVLNVSEECRPYTSVFLRYLYTRKIDITVSSAQCLHQLATNFSLKWLQKEAGLLFSWLLPGDPTFQTPIAFYEYAIHTGDKILEETCLRYLAWNCKALIESPAWSSLSSKVVSALVSRSDVIVPDEAFLLQGVEKWVLAQRAASGVAVLEEEETLLGLIRFTMIPPEKLYDIQFNSSLYASQEELYRAGLIQGYQFNTVSFLKMKNHSDVNSDSYLPRIYTASPWSLEVNFTTTSRQTYYNRYNSYNSYGGMSYNMAKYLETPIHNSALFKSRNLGWAINIYQSHQECQNNGFVCDSVPAARLYPQSRQENNIRYSNRLVHVCDDEYVFHVQDFKNNLAMVPTNSTTDQMYPCHTKNYLYRFVVRPEYI